MTQITTAVPTSGPATPEASSREPSGGEEGGFIAALMAAATTAPVVVVPPTAPTDAVAPTGPRTTTSTTVSTNASSVGTAPEGVPIAADAVAPAETVTETAAQPAAGVATISDDVAPVASTVDARPPGPFGPRRLSDDVSIATTRRSQQHATTLPGGHVEPAPHRTGAPASPPQAEPSGLTLPVVPASEPTGGAARRPGTAAPTSAASGEQAGDTTGVARSGTDAPAAPAQAPTPPTNAVGEPASPSAPGAEVRARMVSRVLDALDVLQNAPPPRRMTIDVPDADGLRLQVALRGTEVHVSIVGGGPANAHTGWGRELTSALATRGFHLGGSGGDAGHQEQRDRRQPPAPPADDQPHRPAVRRDHGLRL